MSEVGAAVSKHFPASVSRLLEDSMWARHQSIFAEAVWANKAGTKPQLKNPLRPKLFQFRSDTSLPLHWTPLEFHVFPQ